ncbi:hypothetical protein [Salinicoccus carnicancri]|uniref:hypothetical protein n=1 Tax=Salinicoccus carnicancri TaxID=558170 RepID=UPI0002E54CDF|nr:hypothetical protein [Salinicoccus carnicancri]
MKNRSASLKFATVILGSTLFLGACSNPFNSLADEINSWVNSDDSAEEEPTEEDAAEGQTSEDTAGTADTETSDEGQSEGTDSDSEETEVQPKDYSGLLGEGEETTLESGTHAVGNDIPAGRYVIAADTGIGNLFISDDSDRTILSTTLNGEEEAQDYGSGEVLAFLEEGQSIEINGLENVSFTPYETEEVSELFTGMWVVGEDFPAGVYEITAEDEGQFGTLETYTHPDSVKARFSLGDSEYGGMSSFVTSFEEGDIVILRNYPSITLTQRD